MRHLRLGCDTTDFQVYEALVLGKCTGYKDEGSAKLSPVYKGLFMSMKHFQRSVAAGIIGRANGFGLYDCFCTKKNCSVKAHHKSTFIPKTSLFFAPGANESAFCCHFVDSLKKL